MRNEDRVRGDRETIGEHSTTLRRLDRIAWVLVVLVLAVVILLYTIPSATSFRPPGLLRSLRLVFAVLGTFLASALFAVRFVRGRELHWLLLGAGALVYGAATFLAGSSSPGDPADTGITIQNIFMAFTGILAIVAALAAGDLKGTLRATRPLGFLVAAYISALALVTLVTWSKLSGLIPPFVVEGTGSSVLRQVVLVVSVATLAISAPLLFVAARARRSQPLRWVALGLALLAISFWGDMGATGAWSLLAWASGGALWLGITYLVVAGFVELRTTQARTSVPIEVLQESEEKYRTLFNSIDEGFCIIEVLFDEEGTAVDYCHLEVNPAFAEHTGLHNAKGKTMRALVPDLSERWFQTFGNVVRTGESVRVIDEARSLTGDWYEAHAFPFGQPGGNQVAVLFRDVTERIESEAALRLREEQYRAFFENAGMGTAQVGPDLRITRVNDRFCEIVGYSREEMVGMTPLDLDHPDEREADRVLLRRLFEEPGYAYDVEKRYVRKDGGTIWVHVTVELVRGADGRPLHTASTIEDITDRKLLEEKLNAERELLQAIYDTIPVMLTVYDPHLHEMVLNKHFTRVTGWTPHDLAHTTIMELVYPDPEYRREVADYMQSLKPGYRDIVMMTRGGEQVDTRWANVSLPDGRRVGIGIDVTELKQEERRRERRAAIQAGTRRIFEQVVQAETEEELGTTVLEVALQVTGSEVGFVAEVGGDGMLHEIAVVEPDCDAHTRLSQAERERPPWDFALHGLYAPVVDDGASVIANDLPPQPETIGLPSGHTPLTSFLGVPLIDGGNPIGILAVGNRQGGYGPAQQEYLEALAPAVVQALLKKRAEVSLLDRTEELEVLNRINRTLVGSVEMDGVLSVALDELRELFDTPAAAAWVVDHAIGSGYGDLVCCHLVGPEPIPPYDLRLKVGEGLASQVLSTSRTLAVSNVTPNDAYAGKVDAPLGINVRAVLSVPLKARDETIGVLALYDDHPRPFDVARQALAESIAAAAAVAVQRAQLYDQARLDADVRATLLREVNHRVKNNLSAILGLIYAERRRLGQRDEQNYDEVLEDLANRVRSLAQVHAILSAGGWRPLNLGDLAHEIVTVSAAAVTEGPHDLTLDVTPSPVRVTPQQAHHLALVIGELATNSAKYGRGAEGLHIRLHTAVKDGYIDLVYCDRGPGFPREVLAGGGRSVGLWLVDSIVQTSLRGEWKMANDGGAAIEVRFPIAAEVNGGGQA